MKLFILLLFVPYIGFSQSIIGIWQQTEQKTCFESELEESETETELLQSMASSSKNSVAKLILFNKNGSGEEGIFTSGKRKGSGMTPFRYNVQDNELHFIDKKSGIVTQRFVIDELTETTLRLHLAGRECETRSFIKVR